MSPWMSKDIIIRALRTGDVSDLRSFSCLIYILNTLRVELPAHWSQFVSYAIWQNKTHTHTLQLISIITDIRHWLHWANAIINILETCLKACEFWL